MDERPYHLPPPCTEPLLVLYQDDWLVIVNKPAFLLSVPGRGPLKQDSVQSRLAAQFDDIRLIHRLDLDTSGLMVFARGGPAQKHLARHFQERKVRKEYRARVAGIVGPDQGEVELPIICDWENRPRQKISEDGKWALTRYRVLSRDINDDSTLVALEPYTGRSHQLRIHMRELGHPIIGCDLYAPADILARSPRLLLHACYIGFEHPQTNQWREFHCPAPFS
ncbi:RluA family pseudouridine synthase [Alcanivorax sp. 1008]|uniref:RluA family pseudouridine synthase n=1 Tax=Alcanivorax sp. 1008 TaxID=2816853 RepID=UPI001E36D30A|nr:RluA family pseudouridine synthase [Alcanivorax sp. 1008]